MIFNNLGSSTRALSPLPPLVLASVSPRRRQLLENLGLPFIVEKPTAEEEMPEASRVEAVTQANSLLKARSVCETLADPSAIVVGADTLVVIEGRVLGKPAGKDEARAMLEALSGRTHEVTTGLTLYSRELGVRQSATVSRVTFRALTVPEREDYLSTREPYDKAGSYAVQGMGALFIDGIAGSYTNVMGLPIETFLSELGKLSPFPLSRWFLA